MILQKHLLLLMRACAWGLTGLFLCGTAVHICAAQSNPLKAPATITSDPAAVALVTQAINAYGGSTVVGSIDGCTLSGSTTMKSGKSYPTTWSHLGKAYRFEVTGSSSSYYVVSNHGAPVKVGNGKQFSLGSRSEIEGLTHLPARVLLDHQNDPQMVATMQSLNAVMDRQSSEANAVVVRIRPKNPSRSHLNYEDWLLDPNTHLPISVHYEVRSQAGYGPGTRFAAYYGQYKTIQSASLPMTTTVNMGGHFLYEINLQSFACGQSFDQTLFQP